MPQKIDIEGLTPDEILALPDEEVDALILCDQPVIFRAGTAELLGQFRLEGNRLVMELAQVENGGEGVLPTLWVLAKRYARQRGLDQVEWIVHAVSCAKPNPKLRRVLERKGFVVETVGTVGEAYHLVEQVS